MSWTKVLEAGALSPGDRKVVKVGDKKILVLNESGTLHAINNACPHMKLPLKKGKIVEGAIVCPFHRSAFDLGTGEAKTWTPFPPGVGKLMGMVSAEKPLTVFPVRVEAGNIEVDL